jgi:hypothetical protein
MARFDSECLCDHLTLLLPPDLVLFGSTTPHG